MSRKILIVDDEPNIVMSLEYAFKKQGYEVYIARDGQEAVQAASANVPDAIILDVLMPRMDGFETLTVIRSLPELADCKVVLLTAKTKNEDIARGMERGADEYLTKPFPVRKLIQTVHVLLEDNKS